MLIHTRTHKRIIRWSPCRTTGPCLRRSRRRLTSHHHRAGRRVRMHQFCARSMHIRSRRLRYVVARTTTTMTTRWTGARAARRRSRTRTSATMSLSRLLAQVTTATRHLCPRHRARAPVPVITGPRTIARSHTPHRTRTTRHRIRRHRHTGHHGRGCMACSHRHTSRPRRIRHRCWSRTRSSRG
jgi:hypothetical protein